MFSVLVSSILILDLAYKYSTIEIKLMDHNRKCKDKIIKYNKSLNDAKLASFGKQMGCMYVVIAYTVRFSKKLN